MENRREWTGFAAFHQDGSEIPFYSFEKDSMENEVHQGSQQIWVEHTLRDYIALVLRGKWIILASFVLVFGLSILYIKLADRTYMATVAVRIDLKQLQSTPFREVTTINGNLSVIQNELQILKSNTLSEMVAQRLLDLHFLDSTQGIVINLLKAGKDEPSLGGIASLDEVNGRVQSSVDFEPVRESDVIKISARSRDPREAALIANLYAQSYFDRNLFASRTKSRSFREFLQSQVRDKQAQLGKSEDELRRYMEAKGVVSLDDNSKRIIEQLSQLESQRDAADISIQALEKTLQTYRGQIVQQEQSVAKVMGEANDPYISRLQAQLAQLEVQRDITVAQNPDYVGKEVFNAQLGEIEGQIQALKAKLRKRTDEFLTNLLPGSGSGGDNADPAGYLRQVKQKVLENQVELQSLQAKRSALTQAISDYNRQFENLPKKNMEFARLQRDKSSIEKLYLTIEEKYNEANITEQAETGYIDIFDPALVPSTPASPKVLVSLLLGAFGGMGLGMFIVFGREYMRDVIRTPEDLKKRGYTPLSTISQMGAELRHRVNGNGKVPIMAPQLVMVTNPLAPVAESYRYLRTNIQLAKRDSAPHTILVTSALEGEGKTTTAANLAIAFAHAKKRTILVDADLRRPMLHTMFRLKAKPGLHELLAGTVTMGEVLQQTEIPDLTIVTSGSIPMNPAEYLGSDRMLAYVAELKERFDVILFDCPPVLAVTDASILATVVDRVILVVSSGRTTVQELDHTVETLTTVGVHASGVVLNNFNPKRAYGSIARRAGYGYYGHTTRGGTPTNGADRDRARTNA